MNHHDEQPSEPECGTDESYANCSGVSGDSHQAHHRRDQGQPKHAKGNSARGGQNGAVTQVDNHFASPLAAGSDERRQSGETKQSHAAHAPCETPAERVDHNNGPERRETNGKHKPRAFLDYGHGLHGQM